jgi:hypothetical protein
MDACVVRKLLELIQVNASDCLATNLYRRPHTERESRDLNAHATGYN